MLVAWIMPILVSLFIGAVVTAGLWWLKDDMGSQNSVFGNILTFVAIFGIVLGVWSGISSYSTIDKGYVGVVTQFGRVTDTLFDPGLNWKTPFVDVVEEVSLRKITYMAANNSEGSADYMDYTIDTNTVDGQRIVISFQMRFQLQRAYAGYVLENYGSLDGMINNMVIPAVRSIARNIAKDFTAEQLQVGATLADCEARTFEALAQEMLSEGITVLVYEIRDIDFDPDYLQTIEDQQIAEERIQTAEYEASAEAWRAQQAITAAQGEAEQVRIAAQADADALLIRANAEAQAVQTLGASLAMYPEYLQLQFIQTWADGISWGILPDSVIPMLNLGRIAE